MSTFRTYGAIKNKVEIDMDLQDETFIQPDEMVGYANEGLKEAFGEILGLKKDNYFLTQWFVPCVYGSDRGILPPNIFANKIRGIMYQNGSIIYRMKQMQERNLFEDIAYVNQYGLSDEYRFFVRNDTPGVPQVQLVPPCRIQDSCVFPPNANPNLHMLLYYIREFNRVPLTGEYYFNEIVFPTAVNTGNNEITVVAGTLNQQAISGVVTSFNYAVWPYFVSPISYVTGDQVQVAVNPYVAGSTLPGGLSPATTYYVIVVDATHIKLATSLTNAQVGTAITLTSAPVGAFNLTVAATSAIQNATLLDIPEYYEFVMQWMKVRCAEKEGDPRYEAMVAELQSQRKMMVDSLVEMIEDRDTEIQGEYAHYLELS